MRRVLLAVVPLFYASTLLGQTTGNEILPKCQTAVRALDTQNRKQGEEFDIAYCLGWVDGARAGYAWYRLASSATDGLKVDDECGLRPQTTGQLTRVFVKWMEAHPEQLHATAFTVFVNAMEGTFPCERVPSSPSRQ
jgi:hypothetical protein